MYFIAAFGLLMIGLSVIMIVNPQYWSKGILEFSRKPYFHWFEVCSRIIVGAVFVRYSHEVLYEQLALGAGYILIVVGIGLMMIGSKKHRHFAVWSAKKFKKTFRPAGIASLIFGGFLICMAIFPDYLQS